MNKHILSFIIAAIPATMLAQTAIDAYQLSRNDLRGTARFMSMGGAFGALGGDLSTLTQNPGGIGVYRKSEIGITLDIEMQSSQATTSLYSGENSQTRAFVNNIGYIGSIATGSEIMPIFNWGFSYGRAASFDRRYHGRANMNGSLSNYIAGYTTDERWSSRELVGSESNYINGSAPWMSILGYNSYIINNVLGFDDRYNGLWQNSTAGVSEFDVEEKGYVDEYSINFGGNFTNTVYWGLGIGITDINYQQYTYYTEDMTGARIPYQRPATTAELNDPALKDEIKDGKIVDGTATGDGGYGLDSRKHISGTGFNLKAGVIVRPINELRIGLAVHTPTFYNLKENSDGIIDYGYGYNDGPLTPGYAGSPVDYREWKLQTPWRLIASAAGVIGTQAIVSIDYEYRPYQNTSMKFDNGDDYANGNNDIKNYYQSSSIIRLGAEYRVTPNFSVRAGYAYESNPTKTDASDMMIYTSNPYDTGTTPSYTLDNTTQYITCGIGYRYKSFYADAAYVHKSRKSEFYSYTPNDYAANYSAELKENLNNIVLSVGFKF